MKECWRDRVKAGSQEVWAGGNSYDSGRHTSLLAVAVGLYITNKANRDQQKLAQQGQVTERFGTSINQLGSDNLDVRLVVSTP